MVLASAGVVFVGAFFVAGFVLFVIDVVVDVPALIIVVGFLFVHVVILLLHPSVIVVVVVVVLV